MFNALHSARPHRRPLSLLAAAPALALAAAAVVPSPAGAQEGVTGRSGSSTELVPVRVQLGENGSLLDLEVLSNASVASIDETGAAGVNLSPIAISSSLIPGLDQLPLPETMSVESTGEGNKSETGGTPVSIPGVLDATLLPTVLDSIVGPDGAVTSTDAGLASLALFGALSIDSVGLDLAGSATDLGSSSTQTTSIDVISILSLGDLLAGLGIPADALPLDDLTTLLGDLGVPVGGLSASDARASVDTLLASISAAEATVAGALGTADQAGACDALDQAGLDALLGDVSDGLDPVTGLGDPVLTAIGAPADLVPSDCSGVLSLITELTGIVVPLLDSMVATAADTPFLAVNGLTTSVTTAASDLVGDSAAEAGGSLGGISLLGLDLPGVDALADLDAVADALVGQADTVLGPLGLADLLQIQVLDTSAEVDEVDDVTTATAALVGLRVVITPPAELTELIDGLLAGTPVADIIDGLGGSASPLPANPLADLGSITGLDTVGPLAGVSAFANGASIELLNVSGQSNFTPVPLAQIDSPRGAESLPRTGSSQTILAILGTLAAAAALGIRRMLETTVAVTTK